MRLDSLEARPEVGKERLLTKESDVVTGTEGQITTRSDASNDIRTPKLRVVLETRNLRTATHCESTELSCQFRGCRRLSSYLPQID